MRTGGTKSKTGDQLDEELENIAASVESSIDESVGAASFSCLKENTDEVLGVFHDMLTTPGFRQDKIDLGQDRTAERHFTAQRRSARHRGTRILRDRLRPEYALWLAAGVRHRGPHRTG